MKIHDTQAVAIDLRPSNRLNSKRKSPTGQKTKPLEKEYIDRIPQNPANKNFLQLKFNPESTVMPAIAAKTLMKYNISKPHVQFSHWCKEKTIAETIKVSQNTWQAPRKDAAR